MFWIIAAVITALVMLVLMSKRAEEDDDPVWLTVLEVNDLAEEIVRWEINLWSTWTITLAENLAFRLDESGRIAYLNELEDEIIELQQELYKEQPMSEKERPFPYFEQETTDLHTP